MGLTPQRTRRLAARRLMRAKVGECRFPEYSDKREAKQPLLALKLPDSPCYRIARHLLYRFMNVFVRAFAS